ncbi:hypothetical protein [Streptomyces azureus]|uniref:Uncharacterized protein n=1 Tax=Streptomyces azureus TaxID=146537 RepID=A0A0K8PPG7_STRAJ|nr:hypothetical protein [Streptomyces azureus]GAP49795.1 putative uncharacterized protein [Streptomyces azureus]
MPVWLAGAAYGRKDTRPVFDDRGATGTEYLGMAVVNAAIACRCRSGPPVTFKATGEDGGPPKGTPVEGVILAGLDSTDSAFAVRVDARQGSLWDGGLDRIIDSVEEVVRARTAVEAGRSRGRGVAGTAGPSVGSSVLVLAGNVSVLR